eukprot:scaffold8485_cov277-Pinguiococcus_pyrenoidosus.AAC.10
MSRFTPYPESTERAAGHSARGRPSRARRRPDASRGSSRHPSRAPPAGASAYLRPRSQPVDTRHPPHTLEAAECRLKRFPPPRGSPRRCRALGPMERAWRPCRAHARRTAKRLCESRAAPPRPARTCERPVLWQRARRPHGLRQDGVIRFRLKRRLEVELFVTQAQLGQEAPREGGIFFEKELKGLFDGARDGGGPLGLQLHLDATTGSATPQQCKK